MVEGEFLALGEEEVEGGRIEGFKKTRCWGNVMYEIEDRVIAIRLVDSLHHTFLSNEVSTVESSNFDELYPCT